MAGTSSLAALDARTIGDAAATITTLASTHGISAAPEPIDDLADTVSRLSDTEVTFERVERLLLALTRAGLVTDAERLALHAAYLET